MRRTHSEEQSGDGSAAFHVNHGEQAGEVALSGSSKEQPVMGNMYLNLHLYIMCDVNERLDGEHMETCEPKVKVIFHAFSRAMFFPHKPSKRARQCPSMPRERQLQCVALNRTDAVGSQTTLRLPNPENDLQIQSDPAVDAVGRPTHREEVKREPLTPPNVERATEMGMIHAMTPSSFSPNVWDERMKVRDG